MKNTFREDIINTSPIRGFKDFNLKEQILKYVRYWYWFLLALIISLGCAFLYLRYSTPLYSVSSSLVILQEDNLSEAGLSAFKELGLEQSQTQIENEIQVLKSKSLIREVVEKLNLNVLFFEEGNIKDVEQYKNKTLKTTFFNTNTDTVSLEKYGTIRIKITSKNSFDILQEDNTLISSHKFGTTVNTALGACTINPRYPLEKKQINKIFKIQVLPVSAVVRGYQNKLVVNLASYRSTVLQIMLRDAITEKAIDFINNLVKAYEESTKAHKQTTSNKTAQFITDRLDLIAGDLSKVDNEAASYLSKHGLVDNATGSAEQAANFSLENKKSLVALQTKRRLLKNTESLLASKNIYESIPLTLSLGDAIPIRDITDFNTLIAKREKLLKSSSTKNPIVIAIEEKVRESKQILLKSLIVEQEKNKLQILSLNQQEKDISKKLYQAPERQKDLRVIAREQGVKEQLYLHLLEKKEEASITSHITVPNSRIIDKAEAISPIPVFPNKKNTYLLALVLGLVIPFSCIYAKELLNTTIKTKQELEELVSTPVLGSIPKAKGKGHAGFSVEKMSRTPLAEAFRMLRSDIEFLLAGANKDNGKLIFVTSTVSGEGKTFVSSNIAKTLSNSDKKVAYVGTDFRKPKFHEFIDLPKKDKTAGFTNFISNDRLNFEDVIYPIATDNDVLDVIPPGIIPPNPSGLLMQDRTKEMFQYLRENYDYIIVDTSPVGLVTDTLVIADLADITIYVVRENYSDKRLMNIPEKLFKEKRLKNMAAIMNGVSGGIGGYGYGYGYGYGNKS